METIKSTVEKKWSAITSQLLGGIYGSVGSRNHSLPLSVRFNSLRRISNASIIIKKSINVRQGWHINPVTNSDKNGYAIAAIVRVSKLQVNCQLYKNQYNVCCVKKQQAR